jgi:hypothetical protein
MGNGTEVAATTDIRRVLRALRPLGALGGFVLVWWCLMTGAAQADSATQHGLASARPFAGHVQHRHQAVRHHVDRVLSAPRVTVHQNPAAPIARVATATVRTHATQVVKNTRPAMAAAPVVPTLSTPEKLLQAEQPVRESSTGQGETRSSHAKSHDRTERIATTSSGMSTDAAEGLTAPAGTTLAGADRAAPSSPAGEGSGSTARTGSASSGASTQPGTGTGTGTGAVVTGNGLRLVAPTAHTSSTSLAVRHCAGPTYPPGSSPD